MKKTLIALATLSALSGVAHADSNVTIYGVIDASVRTSSHQNADGDRLNSVGNGAFQESRVGLKGQEDLGNGLKAIFQLESGFNIGNGSRTQDGNLSRRVATVGLSDATYGTLTIGRQNTLAYDTLIATDVYGVSDNVAFGGYQSTLSGFRWDNSIKYTNTYNGLNYGAEISSGNQTGSNSKHSGYGVNVGYTGSAWALQTVYQLGHDTQDGTLGNFEGQKQKLWAVGGKVAVAEKTDLFAQYLSSKFDVTNQSNRIAVLGISQKLAGNWSIKGSASYDKQENVNEGNRRTFSTVLDYTLSKRTDVYAALDFNKLGGNYSNAAYNLNTDGNSNTSSTGVSLGLRHAF